jgi:hypothetical protein
MKLELKIKENGTILLDDVVYVPKENKQEYPLNITYKESDFVKVLKKAFSYEKLWDSVWHKEMDYCVGKEFEVVEDLKQMGVRLKTCEFEFNFVFPHFVLEKVEKAKEISLDEKYKFNIDCSCSMTVSKKYIAKLDILDELLQQRNKIWEADGGSGIWCVWYSQEEWNCDTLTTEEIFKFKSKETAEWFLNKYQKQLNELKLLFGE